MSPYLATTAAPRGLRAERQAQAPAPARRDGLTAASLLPEMELPARPFTATGCTETAAREAMAVRLVLCMTGRC